MASSKQGFSIIKAVTHSHRYLAMASMSRRFLSFATAEEAAAERRRRKRRLRIEPPLTSVNRGQQPPAQPRETPQNPNAPKIPEPISSLSGNRLNLHNRILKLIRENDLDEAALFTRHSIYSNCRPTIYTVNAVLNAQLRQSKYPELLSLHRFITQAGVAPNIITHNLIFQTYLDCRKPDTALEHYKQLVNDAPFNPSPTTYRILIKGLVDNGKVEKAMEMKEQMILTSGFYPDPLIYHYLMNGFLKNSNSEVVFSLFEELKEKMGGSVDDGVVYGGLMKAYFMKGMEKEAMDCCKEALSSDSKIRMSAIAYNSVLDALFKNQKFDEAVNLFYRMIQEHCPPKTQSVNLGTFNVMVDGYCLKRQFDSAIDVFRKMGDYRCNPDVISFNNLINQLCNNNFLAQAEELYTEMAGKGVNPDEYTYFLLIDACFKQQRIDDGVAYFKKMVESGLRPNLALYKRVTTEVVSVGKIDDAKLLYDMMVKKLKLDFESYKFMIKALGDAGRLDEVLKMVDELLEDDGVDFDEEFEGFVRGELGREGREEELTKLMKEKERKKEEAKAKEIEAAEAAKRSARAAVESLLPSKLFGKKEALEEESGGNGGGQGGDGVEAISMESDKVVAEVEAGGGGRGGDGVETINTDFDKMVAEVKAGGYGGGQGGDGLEAVNMDSDKVAVEEEAGGGGGEGGDGTEVEECVSHPIK